MESVKKISMVKLKPSAFCAAIFLVATALIMMTPLAALALPYDNITKITVSETAESMKVTFASPMPLKYTEIDVHNEAQGGAIVIDFINTNIDYATNDVIMIKKWNINALQISQVKENPRVSAATFILDKNIDYKVCRNKNEIFINFYKKIKKYSDLLTDESLKYEFHFENIPIEEAVKKFAAKTQLTVILKSNVSGKISAHSQGNLYEVLEGVFKFNGFNYSIEDSTIIITGRSNAEEMEVSLKFKELTFPEIAESLSELGKINVVLDKEIPIDKKISFYVHKMKLIDAVKLLVKMYDYILVKIDEGTYVIAPKNSAGNFSQKIKKVFKFKNADPVDVVNLLKKSPELSGSYNVNNFTVDQRTNSLLVYDTPKNIKTVEDLIAKIDEGVRQVDIEVKIVEVQRDGLSRLGIKTVSAVGFSDITKKLKVENINATVEFLENQNKAKVLASPRLLVVDRKTATTLIGEQIPVPSYDYVMSSNGSTYFQGITNTNGTNGTNGTNTGTNYNNNNGGYTNPLSILQSQISGTNANGTTSLNNIAYLPVKKYTMENIGITLDIRPVIHSDTDVTIDLKVDVSSLLSITDDGQIHRGTRNTKTTVRLKDSQTVVFGGIIKQDERVEKVKVPFLGDIPRLGRLFSHTTKNQTDSEMIMLITPHITPFDMPRSNERGDGIDEVVSSSFKY